MNETQFKQKVQKFLDSQGVYHVKQLGCAYTKSGIPDLLACVNGYFLGIELKVKPNKPSELQLYNVDQIRKAGGVAFILYPEDFEDFKKIVKELMNDGNQK